MRWEPARSQRCACQQQQLSRPDRRHVAQTVRFCATRRAPWLAQRALAAATVENRRLQRALDHLEPVAEARLERLRDAGAAKVQAADTARADERKAWAALTDAATTVRDDKKRARLQVEQLARSQAALQHCEATADRQHQLQQLAIKTKHRTDRACCRTTASRWTSSRRAHAPTTQPRNGACNSGGSGACCRGSRGFRGRS